jgi:hypothetical protein
MNLVAAGVVPDGAVSSVTSAHHIQAASMATATDHPGSASVTRTGEEYSVIKVCLVRRVLPRSGLTCEPRVLQAKGEVTGSLKKNAVCWDVRMQRVSITSGC